MVNRISNVACWLVLGAVFIVAGCAHRYREEVVAAEPKEETNVVVPDYVSRAIEAAGGLEAWTKTGKIELDCVVTFYQPDGGFYLTEQHYEIYPWSNSIRISALEPQGRFVWQFSEQGFSVLDGAERFNALPVEVSGRYFAEAILDIATAPVRFLDESVEFSKGPKPVKKEGLWYYPIERSDLELYEIMKDGPKVIFYQNRDSSLVDMIWHADLEREEFLMIRGYDYQEVKSKGIWVPAKIEIFRVDSRGVLQERLVKIDLY